MKVWRNFIGQEGLTRVGSFSFTVLLSFIPLLLSIASIISFFPLSKGFVLHMEKFFFGNFLPSTGDFLYQRFKISLSHAKNLSVLGLSGLFLTAYLTLKSLEKHINAMWHIKIHRKLASSILIYIFFMLLVPLLTCIMLLLQIYTKAYFNSNLNVIFNQLSYLIGVMLFIVIYKVLPATKVKFSHAFYAGFMAGTLFEIAKRLFIFYATNFPVYDILYGSLAAFPLFLLWVYISSLILFFCAQIIFVLEYKADLKIK